MKEQRKMNGTWNTDRQTNIQDKEKKKLDTQTDKQKGRQTRKKNTNFRNLQSKLVVTEIWEKKRGRKKENKKKMS